MSEEWTFVDSLVHSFITLNFVISLLKEVCSCLLTLSCPVDEKRSHKGGVERAARHNERASERERVLEVARSICKRHPILEEFLPSCARSALVSATLVINNNLKEESTATNNL